MSGYEMMIFDYSVFKETVLIRIKRRNKK